LECTIATIGRAVLIATIVLVVLIATIVLVVRGLVQVDVEEVRGLVHRISWIGTLSGSHKPHADLQDIVEVDVLGCVPSEVGWVKARRWELDLDIDLSVVSLLETSSRQDELMHHALFPLHLVVVDGNVELSHSRASLTRREVWSHTLNNHHVSVNTKRPVIGLL
jgi:hypothetical protein